MHPLSQFSSNGFPPSFEGKQFDPLPISIENLIDPIESLHNQSQRITSFVQQDHSDCEVIEKVKSSQKLKRKVSRIEESKQVEPSHKKTKICLEDKSEETLNRQRDLEKGWKRYRYNFALEHLKTENSNKFSEIQWNEFKENFREYLEASLKCCQEYTDYFNVGNKSELFFEPTFKIVEHKLYAIEGTLKFLSGQFAEARNLFEKAIQVYPEFRPTWLSLASVCHRMKEYKDVIRVVEEYKKLENRNNLPIDSSSSTETDSDSDTEISCEESSENNFDAVVTLEGFSKSEDESEVESQAINPVLPLNSFSWDISRPEFSFYVNFSLLGDECIEENYLQLTNSMYVNTEIHYYQAKAKLALNQDDTNDLAEVYDRRGVECANLGFHQQAVFNFEKAQELNGKHCDFYYSESLFAIGEVDKAIENINIVIGNVEDEAVKIKCLLKLVKYYFSCGFDSEAEANIEQLMELNIIKDNLVPLMELYYLIAEMKSRFKCPKFSSFRKISEKFFECYLKMSAISHTDNSLNILFKYVGFLDKLCANWLKHGDFKSIIDTHAFLIEKFAKLIVDMDKFNLSNSDFQYVLKYYQLYLNYPNLIVTRYIHLIVCRIDVSKLSSNDEKSYSLLLENYNEIAKKIKSNLTEFDFSLSSRPFSNKSGILEAVQFLKINFVMLESLQIRDESDSKYELDFIQIMQNYDEQCGEIPDIKEIHEMYTSNLFKINQVILVEKEDAFKEQFCEMIDFLKLDKRILLIQFLAHKVDKDSSVVITKEGLDIFTAIISRVKDVLGVLKVYQDIIESEVHPIRKSIHLGRLKEFRFISLPSIAKVLLKYWKSFKDIGCDQFALEAIGYSKALLEPLKKKDNTDNNFSISELKKLDMLFSALDDALEQVDSIKNQRFLQEALEGRTQHSLDLVYGNDYRPYAVGFPILQIINSLWQVKQINNVQGGKNLSAHYITIVYSLPKPIDGTKRTKKTLHFPCNPPETLFTLDLLEDESKKSRNFFFSRTTRGLKIYERITAETKEKIGLFSLEKSEVAKKPADMQKLSHSEQTFFQWLKVGSASKLLNQLEQHDKCFTIGCKVYMVAFDIGSSFDSCINCRLAALSFQSGQGGDFLVEFQNILIKEGYDLPKENDGLRLKGVTRILAEKQRNCSLSNEHKNPTEMNVKHLQNIGLFQEVTSNVFCSGSSYNTKKKS